MNLFDIPEGKMEEEEVKQLLQGRGIRVERIVSKGHVSQQWYDQEEDEWVLLIQGNADIQFEDRMVSLGKGDSILIPRHQKHFVTRTSTEPCCIWLCLFGMFS